MYLSSVTLRLENRQTMRALASPQMFHGAVQRAVSDNDGRCLWRIDYFQNDCQLLLLSPSQPDLFPIAQQFGDPEDPQSMRTKDYQPFLSHLAKGQRWRFRLKANPVLSVKLSPDANRGRVKAHVTIAQQRDWLDARAAKHGFLLRPDTFDVVHTAWQRFTKRSGHKVTLKVAIFEGVLEVSDPDQLRQSLTQGIGRAKAYGCGLLTLAPL